jgi:membrane fusion protein, multidrug efflux system
MPSEAVKLQAPAASTTRSRRRRSILVAAALLGGFLAWETVTRFVAYTGDAYVRSDLIRVAPQITGHVLSVHVRDDQTVRRGDLLITIDPEPFRLDVAQAKARVREAQAQAAADRDRAVVAKDQADAAQAALELAQETQRRIATLASEGDVSRQAADTANEALQRARSDLAGAEAAIAGVGAALAMHEAVIASAEAELGTAQWRLDRTEIRSPADGAINNLTVRVGDTARAEEPLIGIVDASAWRIIANYKQDYLPSLRLGGPAWVWLDTHPWRFYPARIAGIGRAINRDPTPTDLLPYVAPTTDWIRLERRFPVTIELVDPPPDLTLYMGANARTLIFP